MTVMDEIEVQSENKPGPHRFGSGNKFGKGNPHAKRTHRNRSLFLQAITPDDMQKVTKALIDKAKAGDVQAINTFLNHAAGKPTEESAKDERAKVVRMFLVNINAQEPKPDEVAVRSYVRSKVVRADDQQAVDNADAAAELKVDSTPPAQPTSPPTSTQDDER